MTATAVNTLRTACCTSDTHVGCKATHLAVAHVGHSQSSSPSASSSSCAYSRSVPLLIAHSSLCRAVAHPCQSMLLLPLQARLHYQRRPLRGRACVAPTHAPWYQRSHVSQPTHSVSSGSPSAPYLPLQVAHASEPLPPRAARFSPAWDRMSATLVHAQSQ